MVLEQTIDRQSGSPIDFYLTSIRNLISIHGFMIHDLQLLETDIGRDYGHDFKMMSGRFPQMSRVTVTDNFSMMSRMTCHSIIAI